MADRTSASLFGNLFTALAADGPLDRPAIVRLLWDETRKYDFSYCQMGCDDALVKLGLAELDSDPDEGAFYRYGPIDPRANPPPARGTAMHDKNGTPLKKDDVVLVPMKVRDVHAGEEFCNVTLEALQGRRPDAYKEVLTCNTGVVILHDRPGA